MSLNSGKFYDAKLTRSYCDQLKESAGIYKGYAANTHSAYKSFEQNPLFHGITALGMKRFLTGGMGQMLGEMTDIHDQMIFDQNYIISTFEGSVDSAANARIEFDTLEVINSDFTSYYMSFDPVAKDVKRIVDSLNSEFGEYAHFDQPDSQSAKRAFTQMCSAESSDSGFLKACQKKLVSFDGVTTAYLKARDTKEHTDQLQARMANTAALIRGTSMNQIPENSMAGSLFLLSCLKKGTLLKWFLKWAKQSAKNMMFAAVFVYMLICRNGDGAKKVFEQYFGELGSDTWHEILGFIPQYIDNDKFIEVYEAFRHGDLPFNIGGWQGQVLWDIFGPSISQSDMDDHYEHNCDELSKVYTPGEFIENQGEWEDIQFGTGNSNMSYSGCEIIAVANALHNMGYDLSEEEMAELIRHFEKDGACLNGNIGTAPTALVDYLREEGFTTHSTTSTEPAELNAIGQQYDTIIATVYNDQNDIRQEVHTVCITKDENGKFVVHNAYLVDSNGNYIASDGTNKHGNAYDTLDEAISDVNHKYNSSPIMVTGIEDNRPVLGDFPTIPGNVC